MSSPNQSCMSDCGYTVTDTYEGEYYIVPKVAPPSAGQIPGCEKCSPKSVPAPGGPIYKIGPGPDGKIGTPDDTKELDPSSMIQCDNPSTDGWDSGEVTQDPEAGEKIVTKESQKTGSSKEPDVDCEGCDCEMGTVTIKSKTETAAGKVSIPIKVKLKGPSMNCSCVGGDYNLPSWKEACKDFEIEMSAMAELKATKQEQSYDVSCTCD